MSIEILWRLLVRCSSPVSKGRIWGKKNRHSDLQVVPQISKLLQIHIDRLQSPMVRLKKMILLSWSDNHQRIQSFHYLPGNDHISHLGKVNINLQTYLGICDRSQEGTTFPESQHRTPSFLRPVSPPSGTFPKSNWLRWCHSVAHYEAPTKWPWHIITKSLKLTLLLMVQKSWGQPPGMCKTRRFIMG